MKIEFYKMSLTHILVTTVKKKGKKHDNNEEAFKCV